MTTHLQEGQSLGDTMAHKVVLARGGVLGANTGIGGAHHTLHQSLRSGKVAGWGLQGVEEYDLGPNPSRLQRLYHRWFKHPRQIQSIASSKLDVDLIHITDQEQAHLVPKKSNIPVVVTVHDLFHLFPEQRFIGSTKVDVGDARPSLVRRRDLSKLKKGLARADLLLCDSYATLDACKKYFPTVKSLWLPLGLDLEAFLPNHQSNSAMLEPAIGLEKSCHLLIVGSHDARKRMDFLMSVLGSLDEEMKANCTIHHVGQSNSPTGEDSIEELAKTHDVKNFIGHGGDLSHQALMELRHSAEALLFPSISEGFGYPPLEAMATGTPVLCADMPSHNELMPDGTSLPPDDAMAWLAAIGEVHTRWSKRSSSDTSHVLPTPDLSLIEHAQSYSLEAYCERTSEAYSSLL